MADERYGSNFTIDISQLRAGLSTANKLIRESQSEFKAASAGLDDWRRSEEGLNAKIDSLNKIIPVQKEKVEALKKEYKRLCDEGMKETESRAIELRTQINKEAAALAENEKELKDQKAALDALKSSSDQAGESLEGLEKDTEKTSGGFTVMKGALSSLVAGGFKLAISGVKKLAAEIVNLGKKADDLNTLAKQSGFTVEELQKFEYAADLIDVSVDDIISAAKKLKKNMASDSKDTAAAFEKLGIQIKDDTGKLRDSTTVFYEVIAALSLIENETERDTLAMQLLGQNADSLAGIIDDGGKALAEYGKEAEKFGVILDQKSVNAANKFNDVIDKVKTTGKGVFYSIGAEIATQLTPEIDSLSKKALDFVKNKDFKSFSKTAAADIKSIGSILLNIGKTTLPVASKALSFVANNFKTLAITVGTTVTVFKTFQAVMAVTTAVNAAKTAIAGLSAGVGLATKAQTAWNAAMIGNPIGAVITAVALLAGGIAVLAANTNKASKAEKEYENQIDDLTSSINDAVSAYDSLEKSKSRQLSSSMSELNYYSSLWEELQMIVDENGKVKEGYEERASFIIDRLSKAFGIEFESTDKLIEKYKTLKTSIEDLIKAKKMQIIVDSQEPLYQEAMLNKDNAIKNAEKAKSEYYSAINKIAAYKEEEEELDYSDSDAGKIYELQKNREDLENKLDSLKEAWKSSEELVKRYAYNISVYNHNYEALLSGAEDDMITATYDYISSFKDAENAEKAMLEDSITINKKYLSFLNDLNQGTFEGLYNDQVTYYESMIEEQEESLKKYNTATEEALKENQKTWSNALEENVKKAQQAKKKISEIIQEQIEKTESGGYTSNLLSSVKAGISSDSGSSVNNNSQTVTVNQYNTYSREHSRYELYKSKQETAAALRLALSGGTYA